jgi:phosphohistidine phosphatase
MRLALLRHATAEPPHADDFARRLTRVGERELDALLDVLVASGWSPGIILHSPALRTWQTAQAVHARFPSVPMEPCEALWHGHTEGIFRAAAGRPNPLLVGHEPTMGRLCARLVGAPLDSMPFERAGFALLDVDRLPSLTPAKLLAFLSPGFAGWRPR